MRADKVLATDYQPSDRFSPEIERVESDLTRPLPFEDNSIDSFSAFDVLEHIPRWERNGEKITFPFIELMNEIHRALKPGGFLIAVTPAFPSPAAFQDPTHVNIISIDTADYFCGSKAGARTLGYGFNGYFHKIQNNWLKGPGSWEQTSWINNPSDLVIREKSLNIEVNQLLRFAVRAFRVLRKRKTTHLQWIFQKATDEESENWYPSPLN
jgi:SAM-dependent methyltransferase